MKRNKILKIGLLFVCIIAVLRIAALESTTKQAIDYKTQEFRIPLYLKTLDFMDRHLNYRWTVQKIINRDMSDEQKVDAIFQWTIRRIARQPKALPVIDDHVWHIIVRGYGVSDQMADVFATLANYAGFKACIVELKRPEGTIPRRIDLGAVYFNDAWHICDPWRQTEFVNMQGHWAAISEIVSGSWREKKASNAPGEKDFSGYRQYFTSLNGIDFDAHYEDSRSSIQSPVKRLIQMVRSKDTNSK